VAHENKRRPIRQIRPDVLTLAVDQDKFRAGGGLPAPAALIKEATMTSPPRNNVPPTRGRPFAPGNPGRPLGARHKATRAIEVLLEGQAQALGQRAVQAALEGDMVAMKLCLDRIAPARKGAPIRIELPQTSTMGQVGEAISAVITLVATGELTPDEGEVLVGLLEARRRAIETVEIEARLVAVEERMIHDRRLPPPPQTG
jgi:hypothetical protein